MIEPTAADSKSAETARAPMLPGILPEPSAEFSLCQRYRYVLKWPTGRSSARVLVGIGANPSKAGQFDARTGRMVSDPTVSRLVSDARYLGFGWLWMLNVRAFVATDPKDVPGDPEAIGSLNDEFIRRAVESADMVLCCWGHLAGERAAPVIELIRAAGKVPHALALTGDGTPRHPRGVPKSARPFPMEAP
jgi:hypothetical protein